jgi:hypothetical protein
MMRHVSARPPGWLKNWLERHQTRFSRVLHYIGIPLAVAAVVLAGIQLIQWRWDLWWRPVVLLVLGYVPQLIGHLHEGNDMGEVVLVKRLLGRPYQAVAPQFGGERVDPRAEKG